MDFRKPKGSHAAARGADHAAGGEPVRYLDGSSLNRPLDLPRSSRPIVIVLLVAAALVGAFMLFKYFDAVVGGPAREAQQVEQNLARDVSYDLPVLTALAAQDDDAIKQSLTDAGYTLYDTTDPKDYPKGGFSLVKLPSDVSLIDAGALYAQGVSNLSGSDAARLLKGSWTLTVDRSNLFDARVRYADFASGSIDAAIQAAIDAEQLGEAERGESGVDDAGNTYQAGTVEANGVTYAWRVSAIALSSMYDIDGLPDNAVYVGVRLTQQA